MGAATFQVATLGCRANQYDSERLAEALAAMGLSRAPQSAPPDVLVVNTCTVTQTSDRKCRQLVRRALRQHPRSRVFVTGCYATAQPQVFRAMEGVAGVFGRQDWDGMLQAIAGGALPESVKLEGDFGIRGFAGHARALLKIQEGCDFRCAYCIVPHVRGAPRSRPLREVVAEAQRLIGCGFRELVLTGIHLGLYGRDLGDGLELADAVQKVASLRGVGRLRLSSLEAPELTGRLLCVMEHPAVCAHLHLPLQSGDDAVLRRMKRRYTVREFLAAVDAARRHLDRPLIGADVIVGFPGESEEAFRHTLQVCRQAAFGRLHVFPFSRRAGTEAARLGGQVAASVIKERCACLKELAGELGGRWARSFVGRRERVLFEEATAGGELVGYTDRYVRLSARAGPEELGELRQVRCVRACGASLTGELVGQMQPAGNRPCGRA